ncbi:MAG: hypothetical protein V1724_09915 [Chloroflexota bacterium]
MKDIRQLVKDLYRAIREGFPIGRKLFWTVFQVILVIIAVFGIGIAPWKIPDIEDPFLRGLAWTIVIAILLAAAVSIGLTPFLGQRKVTQRVEASGRASTNALVDQVHSLTEEVRPLREMYERQKGHEQEFLRLVVEDIDLSNIEGLAPDRIRIKFQVDSGLVYHFQPYRVQVVLDVSGATPNEPWELTPSPNLLAGNRTQLATQIIPITGERLRAIVGVVRNMGQAEASLKLLVTLRPGNAPLPILSDSRRWVVRRAT